MKFKLEKKNIKERVYSNNFTASHGRITNKIASV